MVIRRLHLEKHWCDGKGAEQGLNDCRIYSDATYFYTRQVTSASMSLFLHL